jgi:hypothetical protein
MLRLVKALLCTALIGAAIWAGWLVVQGHRAGVALDDLLSTAWPRGGPAASGTRERLLAAAESLRGGDFGDAAVALRSPGPLSGEDQAAADRFLARHADARRRLLAAATAAQAAEAAGSDVRPARDALSRAVAAAARRNSTRIDVELEIAETALTADSLATPMKPVPMDRDAAAARLAELAPGFELARNLLSEGAAAADKLLARASWHFREGRFAEAVALISLAGQLLAIEPANTSATTVPAWFEALAQAPLPDIPAAQAKAAVELCTAMAAAEPQAAPLQHLVDRARREATSGQPEEAYWWATVALAALGMSEEEIAAVGVPEKL